MKKSLTVAAVSALMAIGSQAQAQTYVEVGYTMTKSKSTLSGLNYESEPAAVRAVVGYEINPNVAIEGMVGLGVGNDKLTVNGRDGGNLKIKNAYGMFIKPKMKVAEGVEVFARLGYATIKGTATGPGGSATSKDSDMAYGAGLSYAINPKMSLNADYLRYYSEDGDKVGGFTFGVGYKF